MMKNLLDESKKILKENKGLSIFDTIDKLKSLYEAAEDEAADEEGADNEAEGEGEEAAPPDPTEPAPEAAEGQPAKESEGIYISSNQKAIMAKTMLDALMAKPPQTGEIPEELLNVTDANADDVIKYVQSLLSLATTLDTSSLSDANPDSLMSELKTAKSL